MALDSTPNRECCNIWLNFNETINVKIVVIWLLLLLSFASLHHQQQSDRYLVLDAQQAKCSWSWYFSRVSFKYQSRDFEVKSIQNHLIAKSRWLIGCSSTDLIVSSLVILSSTWSHFIQTNLDSLWLVSHAWSTVWRRQSSSIHLNRVWRYRR